MKRTLVLIIYGESTKNIQVEIKMIKHVFLADKLISVPQAYPKASHKSSTDIMLSLFF